MNLRKKGRQYNLKQWQTIFWIFYRMGGYAQTKPYVYVGNYIHDVYYVITKRL